MRFFTKKDGEIQYKESLWKGIKKVLDALPDGVYQWADPEKKKNIRSLMQNAYYFGVVCTILGDEVGYTKDEMHQLLARKFLSYEKDGETFVKSTSGLKTMEFEEYLEECRRFGTMELYCFIPLPNETKFSYEVK